MEKLTSQTFRSNTQSQLGRKESAIAFQIRVLAETEKLWIILSAHNEKESCLNFQYIINLLKFNHDHQT